MKSKKLIAALLVFASVVTTASPMTAVYADNTETAVELAAEAKSFDVDFTSMTEVPVYSVEKGEGFVSVSSAIMPDGYNYERKVADVSEIVMSEDKGASVTESDGAYLNNSADYNYGGLIYRVDTVPGAYKIEVELSDGVGKATVAPTGMKASDLTRTSNWDTAGLVNRVNSAKWEDSKWSYDYASGQDFIEIEIEPNSLPTANSPVTIGVKSIKVTPLAVNPKSDKPTIHILGDSTQKTYTFNSTISSWGQTLVDYFDKEKANVVNYSTGGRSMKANYTEGRTNDVLMRGKEGDFVFIHSAHNDETSFLDAGAKRFGRGGQGKDLAEGNALYYKWIDMYADAIRARGMIPVFVTAMPRTSSGKYYAETDVKPNGFNPDSPRIMREKAKTSNDIGLVELYAGAKEYIDSLDAEEIRGIYNTLEAGEMPGGADGSSTANGNSGDGTHYKEAAGRQWCRIMLQSIYDQSTADEDTYTDREIMKELVGYMRADVQAAAESKNWSVVFPEMAEDVSAVGIVPGAVKQEKDNYYFRSAIEKVLQLGIMKKDASNKFYPTNSMTVGEFARSAEKAFGLDANSLTSYNMTYAELTAAGAEPLVVSNGEASAASEEIKLEAVDGSVTNAEVSDGKTVVTLENISEGTVIGVKHDGAKIANVKTAEVSGNTVTLDGIEADSVFVWNSLTGMKPLSNVYDVSVSEGMFRVKVSQPEGANITIYNESNYNTATADMTEALNIGDKVGNSDSDKYFTLTIGDGTLNKGNDKSGTFQSNKDVTTGYVEVNSSGRVKLRYTAKADGTVTVYARIREDRAFKFENITDGKTEEKYILGDVGTASGNHYGEMTFTVEAGKEYDIYSQGTSSRLFGLQYASDYENSTDSLLVSNGDEVRVVVQRENANYLVDSIIVNGDSITSTGSTIKKEGKFTVSGNTTVSANILSNPEPQYVGTTLIASDAVLTRQAMAAVLYDAYLASFGKDSNGSWIKPDYMTKYNGGSISPDDPNYDPNITSNGGQYYPMIGWDALSDIDDVNKGLYAKTKEVYNLGLMRSDLTYSRGTLKNGTAFEPETEVTRARAAKALAFIYIMTQPVNNESQVLPEGNLAGTDVPQALAQINENAPSTPFEIKQ